MTRKPPRTLTPQFKMQVVLESIKDDKKSDAEIGRQYDIHPQLIGQWRRQFLRLAPTIFENKRREVKNKNRKVEELEKIIGKQTIEIQFLKKVLGHLG